MSTFLIQGGAVLTPTGWLEPGYVVIEGTTIAAVGAGTPPPTLVVDERLNAAHSAILPGFINGHTHLSQTFMRGLAGGRPLLRWLKELIWPLQAALSPEELHLAALLGLVENLRCGATEVVDHHKITTTPAHTDAVLAAAQTVGLRLTLARAWVDRGANAEAPAAILADLERLYAAVSHQPSAVSGQPSARDRQPMVTIANGPLATWRCSAETLHATQALARRYGAPTHIHVAETQDEVALSRQETGLPPVAWLDSLSLLAPDTQIVHAVWVNEEEQALLAARGALVVHCPVSNAVLGSGIAPVAALHRQGVALRLGTDGPASNDTQDILETAKSALQLARAATLDPTALTPATVLALATGGRTLAPGVPADLIVVNLNHPRAAPVYDVTSALMLSCHGSDVETVFVNGRCLLREGRLLVLDEAALLAECRTAIRGLRQRAGLTV